MLRCDYLVDHSVSGATVCGMLVRGGQKHQFEYSSNGRNVSILLDGKIPPDPRRDDWINVVESEFDLLKPVREVLAASFDHDDCENWSARVVDGDVVRLIVCGYRGCVVLVGELIDDW